MQVAAASRLRRSAASVLSALLSAGFAVALTACASTSSIGRQTVRGGADSVALARELSGGTTTSSAIGVLPFQLLAKDDGLSALGFALADLLTTDLSRSARISLVERSRLTDVLRELDLARTGRVDSASAPRVGKLVRARRLVLGSVDTLKRGELRLSVRVADVETGALDASLDATAPLTDVLAAEKRLALRLFESLGVTLTPAERAAVDAYPTTSLAALTAYGRGVQADARGDHRRAVDEFERALVVDPGFSLARTRAAGARVDVRRSAEGPSISPGIRSINAPIAGTVDRVNRPIDVITSLSRPLAGPGDPSFPSTIVTVVITVTRP
jgi:TolB-like protein